MKLLTNLKKNKYLLVSILFLMSYVNSHYQVIQVSIKSGAKFKRVGFFYLRLLFI